MTEISTISPSAVAATDRFLARRGSGPHSLELLNMTPTEVAAALSEIGTARGPSANLRAEMLRLASVLPRPFKDLPAGVWIDQSFVSSASGTVAQVANTLRVFPFILPFDKPCDQAAVRVTTGVASAEGRIVIYDSDGASGGPGTLLWQGASQAHATSNVNLIDNLPTNWVFQAGKLYWVGIHSNSTQTLRGIVSGGTPVLWRSSPTDTHPFGGFSQTVTYASGPPSTWGSLVGVAMNSGIPSIFFRTE